MTSSSEFGSVAAKTGVLSTAAQSATEIHRWRDMRSPTPHRRSVFPDEVYTQQKQRLTMKRVGLVMVLLVVGIVQTLSAAVQYEFRQTTHSDLESMPPTDVTGRGIIDGDRSRVEFLSGTGFEIGTYIISTN